jgi:hypothetical protein
MKLLSEYELTITTAGTPVALTANTSAQKAVVCNNNTDTRIVTVGKATTIDALSTPPVGLVLEAGDSVPIPVHYNASELAVDASTSGTKVTIQIYG